MSARSVVDLEGWLQRPWVLRVVSMVLALGTGSVLATAAWLEPAAEGHGTHLQLGLGQCTFLQYTDVPCPMCGATTTFTLLAHLRVVEGLVNQPFAALLFAMTVVVFAIATSESILPRGLWGKVLRPMEPYEGRLALGFLGLMVVGWVYKAIQMGSLTG